MGGVGPRTPPASYRRSISSVLALPSYLELAHALCHLDAHLEHVDDLVIVCPGKDDVVWSLLAVQPDHEEGGVVLLRPERERSGILERMDGIRFGEGDCIRLLELHLVAVEGSIGASVGSNEVCTVWDVESTSDHPFEPNLSDSESCAAFVTPGPAISPTHQLRQGNLDSLARLLSPNEDGRLC